jgi:predicted RNA binding protein YcfA (HicA-like mRNA interferase family)
VPKLPQIKGNKLVKALTKLGWYVDRTGGSHVIMRNDTKRGNKLVIPVHKHPVAPGTLNNILKTAEVMVDKIKELL